MHLLEHEARIVAAGVVAAVRARSMQDSLHSPACWSHRRDSVPARISSRLTKPSWSASSASTAWSATGSASAKRLLPRLGRLRAWRPNGFLAGGVVWQKVHAGCPPRHTGASGYSVQNSAGAIGIADAGPLQESTRPSRSCFLMRSSTGPPSLRLPRKRVCGRSQTFLRNFRSRSGFLAGAVSWLGPRVRTLCRR